MVVWCRVVTTPCFSSLRYISRHFKQKPRHVKETRRCFSPNTIAYTASFVAALLVVPGKLSRKSYYSNPVPFREAGGGVLSYAEKHKKHNSQDRVVALYYMYFCPSVGLRQNCLVGATRRTTTKHRLQRRRPCCLFPKRRKGRAYSVGPRRWCLRGRAKSDSCKLKERHAQ